MFLDKLDSIMIPTWSELADAYDKRFHPAKYLTHRYVEDLETQDSPDWNQASKNLAILGNAEKNYCANSPARTITSKIIGGLTSVVSILAITHAEQLNTFATKAWPHVFKDNGLE